MSKELTLDSISSELTSALNRFDRLNDKALKGYEVSAAEARTLSLEIRKLFKEYRRVSIKTYR